MAQIAPVLGDRDRNLALHLEQIAAAGPAAGRPDRLSRTVADRLLRPRHGARPGHRARRPGDPRNCSTPPGRWPWWPGFVEESPRHRFYNTAFYAEGGRVVHLHRKVYLPTYGLFDEQRYFAAGERFLAFDTARFGRVGILDLRGFLAPFGRRHHAGRRGRLLICPSNSPARGVEGPKIRTAETYEHLAKAFAQLMGAVVIVVNRVGFEDGLCFWGGSMAVGPDGRIDRPGPDARRGPDAGRLRSGRAPPPAADHALGPRRAAAADHRRTQSHQTATAMNR